MALEALQQLLQQPGTTTVAPTNTPIAPAMPAAPAAAEPGVLDFLKSTPLGLALIQSGLSMGGGMPAGQAFSQGLGMYQQMMANQAAQQSATAKGKQEASWKEREFGQKDRELDIKEMEAKNKGDKDGTPPGVDPKRWAQALETASLSLQPGETVDTGAVYRMYNTMLGEGESPAFMSLDAATIKGLAPALLDNPDASDAVLERFEQTYGPIARQRLERQSQAILSQRTKAMEREEADRKAAEEAEANEPGIFQSLFGGVQSPAPAMATPAGAMSAYSTVKPSASGNPWANLPPEVLKAMMGQ